MTKSENEYQPKKIIDLHRTRPIFCLITDARRRRLHTDKP